MKGVVLIICLLLIVNAQKEEVENEVRQWMTAIEELVSHISLGPFKKDFTPEYIAKRTVDFALKRQTNNFRGLVASTIIQTVGDNAIACIDPTRISEEESVKIVIDELKDHGFDVLWIHSMQECLGRSGLSIKVPPAAKSKE